jgi:branched-chain amino acid transport system substrate-binding protein
MAILSKVALLAGATVMMAGAARADTVKIGVLTSYSGITADAGRQADADIKIFTEKWGKTIAGHTLQYIRRDTTGPNPAVAKPRAQDLIFREKVQIINGLDFTPNILAIAPLATAGKVPIIITGGGTSNTVASKSPYYARTFQTEAQVSRPIADWAFKHGIKKVYTVVADYAPGFEAEKAFIAEFEKDGGTIVGSVRVPTRSPEFSAYMQRVKDSHPDAMFGFMPLGELSVGLIHAYGAAGLKQDGIRLIGTGAIVDEGSLQAQGDAAIGVITSFPYSPDHKSKENDWLKAQWAKVTDGKLPLGFAGIAFWDGMQLIHEGLMQQPNQPFSAEKFMKYLAGAKIMSPRGPIEIDPKTHDIIQNVYIRKVERVNGLLENVETDTFPNVAP